MILRGASEDRFTSIWKTMIGDRIYSLLINRSLPNVQTFLMMASQFSLLVIDGVLLSLLTTSVGVYLLYTEWCKEKLLVG